MAKEINEEIQNLLRGKDHNASGLDAFAQYNVAVKNVMHQLTPQEESRLRKMAAEWSEKGNPPEIQRKLVLLPSPIRPLFVVHPSA